MLTLKYSREGTAIVLVVIMLAVFLIMAAVSINVAYMQLVRTEMRAATDAAARAGTEALARQDSTVAAIDAAITLAAANTVNGQSLQLTASDIQLGRATSNDINKWTFDPNATPVTSVRVVATKTVPLMLSNVTGRGSYSPSTTATAAFSENEICLVVDRSHSMCFDTSGVDFAYPPGTPAGPSDPIIYPPQSVGSRWAALSVGINSFLSIVSSSNAYQKVSLVTWGSQITLADYEGGLTGRTFPASTVDVPLGTNFPAIATAISNRGNDVMLGGTNIAAGIDLGVEVLTGPGTRAYASKTMIVMTDGKWNMGRPAIEAAQDAKLAGITVYTVTFLDADQQDMKDVAAATGGRHYHASDADTLQDAFVEMARHLAVVLID